MAVLVVGGTKGVGRAIALEFSRNGADVCVVYNSDEHAALATVAAAQEQGAALAALKVDIGTRENCFSVLEQFERTGWQLDHVVHCAVYPLKRSLEELTAEEFDRVLAVATGSLLYLAQAAIPHLRSGASITYISSGSAKIGSPGIGPVGIPKAASEALVRYLAVELGPRGIRTNCVIPGMLVTDSLTALFPDDADGMRQRVAQATPSHRPVTFEDVAKVVHFIASPGGELINGREIVVDGGFSVLRIRP